jgi:hypothetical protein
MRLLAIASVAVLICIGSASAGQRRAEVSEPLLPSDAKQCAQMASDYQGRVDDAMRATNACTDRRIQLARSNQPSGGRMQTNKACLAQLPESQRDVLAFTCNENSLCGGENTAFYELLTRKKEATDSCYAKVNVYKAVAKALEDLAKKTGIDRFEELQRAKELEDLARYTGSRDLELHRQMEARAANVFLKNQRLAREVHKQAMQEFYNHANWVNAQYQGAMDQVFNGYLANQQTAWRAAQGSAESDSRMRMKILENQGAAFRSAYGQGCQRGPNGEPCGER